MNTGSGRGAALAHEHLPDAQPVAFVDRFAASGEDANQLSATDQDVLIGESGRVLVEVLLVELQFRRRGVVPAESRLFGLSSGPLQAVGRCGSLMTLLLHRSTSANLSRARRPDLRRRRTPLARAPTSSCTQQVASSTGTGPRGCWTLPRRYSTTSLILKKPRVGWCFAVEMHEPSFVRRPDGPVGAASAVSAVVRYDDELVHLVAEGQRDVVEGLDVLVECRNDVDVGSFAKIGRDSQVRGVVADRGAESQGLNAGKGGWTLDNPLAGPVPVEGTALMSSATFQRGEVFLPLPAQAHVPAVGVTVLGNDPDCGVDHLLRLGDAEARRRRRQE